MRTHRRPTVHVALSLLLAGFASAAGAGQGPQPDPGVVTFTLTQAVELALATNPEVLAVREQTEEFGERVREAKAEALPQVEADLSWRKTRDPGLRNSPFFTRFAGGDGNDLPEEAFGAFFLTNYLWNVGFTQPIFTFGRVSNAMTAAREERSGVNLDIQEIENRVSYDVARSAFSFLLAQHNLAVLTSEKDSRERQLERVQIRFELEDATKLDLLRAQVTLANLQPEILTAENNLQVALASVNSTLGRPIDAAIEVLEELDVPDEIPNVLPTAALLEIAGQYRPELRRYGVNRNVLDAQVGLAKSQLLPQVSASGGFGVNTFGAGNVSDLALHTWNIGVNFDWKLYDGRRTSAQVAALRSQKTRSGFDEHAFRNTLSVSLTQANGTWLRALEALDVTLLTVDQAKEAERVAEESLVYGAATSLDVIEATLSLRQAELNQVTAAHDALVALAEMKYLVGFRADAPHAVIEGPRSVAGAPTDSEGSQP